MNPLTRKITRVELDAFIRTYAGPGRTLDIGSGTGPYREWFRDVIAVDIRNVGNVALVADAHRLPFSDATFDFVVCTEVLKHLIEPRAALHEMFSVLRDGGILLLTTRFIFPIHDAPHDYFRFTRYGLLSLVKDFEVLELRAESDSIGALSILIQRLGFQTAVLGSRRLALIWHVAAQLIRRLGWLVTKEYGASPRRHVEPEIMTTGYYVACRKPDRQPAGVPLGPPVGAGLRE